MNAVFRKALRRCYGSLFGYVIATVLLATLGVCMVLYHVNPTGGSADLSMTLQTLVTVLMVVIPALCTYTVTLERKREEDRFLYSLPLSVYDIVLGRFFAVLSVICIPLSMLLLFPLVFSFYGSPAMGTAFLSMLGLILLMGAMVALCTLLASLTRSLSASFFGGFGVLLAMYFVSPVVSLLPASLSTPVLQFLSSFDIFLCFDSFTYGRIDVAGVVNTLLFIFLFLFLGAYALHQQKSKEVEA